MRIRSMRGVEIDMAAIIAQNESTVAVGNANMNARGDVVGKHGEVLKTRDEIAQEYHQTNPKAVKTVSLKDVAGEVVDATMAKGSDKLDITFADPAAAVAEIETKAKKRRIEDTDN